MLVNYPIDPMKYLPEEGRLPGISFEEQTVDAFNALRAILQNATGGIIFENNTLKLSLNINIAGDTIIYNPQTGSLELKLPSIDSLEARVKKIEDVFPPLPLNVLQVFGAAGSSGTWVVPKTGYYWIIMVGGGGGGAGGFGRNTGQRFVCGGSGGGSGYVAQFICYWIKETVINYYVARGGSAGYPSLNGLYSGAGGAGETTRLTIPSQNRSITVAGGSGATPTYSANNNTSNAGTGRCNGEHGFYGVGEQPTYAQLTGGKGGDGHVDLNISYATYGGGGHGGAGGIQSSWCTYGANGGNGVIIIYSRN